MARYVEPEAPKIEDTPGPVDLNERLGTEFENK